MSGRSIGRELRSAPQPLLRGSGRHAVGRYVVGSDAAFRVSTPSRRTFSSSGITSGSCSEGVLGRGEYLNPKTASNSTSSSRLSVCSNSASVSPGNPTITSVVTLISRLPPLSRRSFPDTPRECKAAAWLRAPGLIRFVLAGGCDHRAWDRLDGRDDIRPKMPWMRSRETHPLDSWYLGHGRQQFGKRYFAGGSL